MILFTGSCCVKGPAGNNGNNTYNSELTQFLKQPHQSTTALWLCQGATCGVHRIAGVRQLMSYYAMLSGCIITHTKWEHVLMRSVNCQPHHLLNPSGVQSNYHNDLAAIRRDILVLDGLRFVAHTRDCTARWRHNSPATSRLRLWYYCLHCFLQFQQSSCIVTCHNQLRCDVKCVGDNNRLNNCEIPLPLWQLHVGRSSIIIDFCSDGAPFPLFPVSLSIGRRTIARPAVRPLESRMDSVEPCSHAPHRQSRLANPWIWRRTLFKELEEQHVHEMIGFVAETNKRIPIHSIVDPVFCRFMTTWPRHCQDDNHCS